MFNFKFPLFHFLVTLKVFTLLSVTFDSAISWSANPCDDLKSYGKITIPHDHQDSTIAEFLKKEEIRENESSLFAKKIFESYLRGGPISQIIEKVTNCLVVQDVELLSAHLQSYAKKKSVEVLNSWGEQGSNFAKLVAKNKSVVSLFRHPKSSNFGAKRAGFHRGTRSVFMSLVEIDYRDWMTIFVHEYAHVLDETLRQNVLFFGNIDRVLRIEKLANTPNLNEQTINQEDYDLIYQWCLSSFQRGILAETRAWAVTAALYLEARNNRKIDKLRWMNETFFDGDRTNEKSLHQNFNIKYSEKIYDKLNSSFTTSYEGIFSVPIFKKVIEKISHEIKANPLNFLNFDQVLVSIIQ